MAALPHRRTSRSVALFSIAVLVMAAGAGWPSVVVLAAANAALWTMLLMLRRRDIKRRHMWIR
jgi:hypothetical protein